MSQFQHKENFKYYVGQCMTLLPIKISQKYEVAGEKKTNPDIQVHVLYHDTICIQIEEKTSS